MTDPSPARSSQQITRIIKAPRQAVYRAFLDADAVAAWLPPDAMRGQMHLFEPREGGRFRISLTYLDPADSPGGKGGKTSEDTDTVEGRFVRLVPDTTIVEAVEFESEQAEFAGEMRMTVQLADVTDGTQVTMRFENLPPGVRLEDNEEGARQSLQKLAALLEGQAESRQTFVVFSVAGRRRDFARDTRHQPFWDEHARFIDHLVAEGFILMGGPLVDEGGAMLVVRAQDEHEVRERLSGDPWYREGILQQQSVKRWQIFIDER